MYENYFDLLFVGVALGCSVEWEYFLDFFFCLFWHLSYKFYQSSENKLGNINKLINYVLQVYKIQDDCKSIELFYALMIQLHCRLQPVSRRQQLVVKHVQKSQILYEYTEQQQYGNIKKSSKKNKNKAIKKSISIEKKKKNTTQIQLESKPKRKYTKRQVNEGIEPINIPVTRSRRTNNNKQKNQINKGKNKNLNQKTFQSSELIFVANFQDTTQQDQLFVENEVVQQERLYICEDYFESQLQNEMPTIMQKQNQPNNILSDQRQDQSQLIYKEVITPEQAEKIDTTKVEKIQNHIQNEAVEIQQIIVQLSKIQLSQNLFSPDVVQEQKLEVLPTIAIEKQQIDKQDEQYAQNEQNRFIIVQEAKQQEETEDQPQSVHQQSFSLNLSQAKRQSNQINIYPKDVIIFKNWINYDQLSQIINFFKQRGVIYCSVNYKNGTTLEKLSYEEVETLRPDLICNFFNKIYPVC